MRDPKKPRKVVKEGKITSVLRPLPIFTPGTLGAYEVHRAATKIIANKLGVADGLKPVVAAGVMALGAKLFGYVPLIQKHKGAVRTGGATVLAEYVLRHYTEHGGKLIGDQVEVVRAEPTEDPEKTSK